MTVKSLLQRAEEQRPSPTGHHLGSYTAGQPLDASIRLLDALQSADIIAAEDTRRTRALAETLGITITGNVVSNFDHNEADRADYFVTEAQAGKRVLVVTDAGMPAVSDPGFPLVVAAREAGVPVTCLPGLGRPHCARVIRGRHGALRVPRLRSSQRWRTPRILHRHAHRKRGHVFLRVTSPVASNFGHRSRGFGDDARLPWHANSPNVTRRFAPGQPQKSPSGREPGM